MRNNNSYSFAKMQCKQWFHAISRTSLQSTSLVSVTMLRFKSINRIAFVFSVNRYLIPLVTLLGFVDNDWSGGVVKVVMKI